MYATPLLDNDNQIIGAIEVNQDITDLKKTERSLQQSLRQWDAIFDQSLFGIVYFSQDNTILRINERLAGHLQKTPTSLTGLSIENVFDATTTFTIAEQIQLMKNNQVIAFKLSGTLKQLDNEKLANQFTMYFVHDNQQINETATVGLVFITP